jgi:hypothetical protein
MSGCCLSKTWLTGERRSGMIQSDVIRALNFAERWEQTDEFTTGSDDPSQLCEYAAA